MNLDLMKRDVRPAGVYRFGDPALPEGTPVLLCGDLGDVTELVRLAPSLGYGTAVVLRNVCSVTPDVEAALLGYDFVPWSPAGVGLDEKCWVRSHFDGNTYGTHLPYLLKAVELTTGPVLELGCGEGSTQALHDAVAERGRDLISVDNDEAWIKKFSRLTMISTTAGFVVCSPDKAPTTVPGGSHTFWFDADPARQIGGPWSVVFVDHAPGETRKDAVARAADVADFIVVHDTEDVGYELEPALSAFKYRRDFRYARPWTTVVSNKREIFPDPRGVER